MSDSQPDPSLEATPSDLGSNSERAAKLEHFVAEVRKALDGRRPNLGPNLVQVSPGGKTFATIGEALASITDASQKKQYVCYIGPGTYNEIVVCKPWVFLQGEGPDQTIIANSPAAGSKQHATVVGASNSAIQNLAATATSQAKFTTTVALACNGVTNFDIENCSVLATDTLDTFTWALVIDFDTFGTGLGSTVNLAYSSVIAQTIPRNVSIGLGASNQSVVLVTQSKIVCTGIGGNGAQATGNSQMTLYNSYVEGVTYCLTVPDEKSICVANQCELKGPVDPMVVVNP